jgi:multidrug efflux pump subunit AcrB
MKKIIGAFVGNTVLANVVLLILIVCGVLATTGIIRESMPELKINQINVDVSYPGTDPEESEQAIARRLEAAIDGMEGVKQYHTVSHEGGVWMGVEVNEDRDIEEMRDRVRGAVDSITTFPAGVRPARVTVATATEDVMYVALSGDLSERQFKEWGESVREEMLKSPNITIVEVLDTRPYEIQVEVSEEALLKYDLALTDVSEAIRRNSSDAAVGKIDADGQYVRLRTIGRRETGKEFASVVVKTLPNGETITLDEVATVTDGFDARPTHATLNGEPCISLGIKKAQGEDAIGIAAAVRDYIAEHEGALPAGLKMTVTNDQTEFIKGQIDLLVENGIMGLVFVLVILWIFLDTRLSFWVAMGIPISMAGALTLMWILGATFNQISLISFIVVLGIIVDDAIVVGEAIYVHRKMGKGPLEAAVDGVCEVGLPVLAAVVTTALAFLPLAFIPGVMGQFMVIMPIVVVSALVISLVECLFLLPAHLSHLPDPDAPTRKRWWGHRLHQRAGHSLEWFAEKIYAPTVKHAVKYRYVSLCVALTVVLLTVGLLQGGFIRVVFWPPIDGDFIQASIEFPDGTPPALTQAAVEHTRQALEETIKELQKPGEAPLVNNVTTSLDKWESQRGNLYVHLASAANRSVQSQDISAAWEKATGLIPGALVQRFSESSVGGGGAPIEFWLQGKEIPVLRAAAQEVKAKLRQYDGVYQIADDFQPGKMELHVELKPEAYALGLDLSAVSRQLQAGYYGEEALRLQRGRDDVRVLVRYPRGDRKTMEELEQTRIRTPQGHEVPLLSVATVDAQQGLKEISGSNGLRRVRVTAACDTDIANPDEVVAELSEKYMDGIVAGYADVEWSLHGAASENQQTMAGLMKGFLIAVLAIFVVMAAMFKSYVQPFVILMVVPFGIVGAFVGHMVLGIPVTFLSLFGLVALTGVVVNDAIVLIVCANNMLKEGVPFFDAVCKAGVRRFRAIILTTLSTCGALIPLMVEKNIQAQIVIPMAASIAFGVAFATVLTLLFIPCLLCILNDARRLAFAVRYRRWPSVEEVEPGYVEKEVIMDKVVKLETNKNGGIHVGDMALEKIIG